MGSRYPAGPRVRIQVTREAISRAVATDSTRCWISESIKAQLPEVRSVAVDLATVRFTDPNKGLRYVYLTPYSAQRALLDFDEGNPPPPFAFLLKNAHVTKAGSLPAATTAAGREARTKEQQRRDRQNARARAARREARDGQLKSAAFTYRQNGRAGEVRRVGGRRPPQLRVLRKFGIRAFRGASHKRLQADQALIDRAERGE